MQIRSAGGGNRQCIDYNTSNKKSFGMYQCHSQGGNQVWNEKSKMGEKSEKLPEN